MALVTAAAAMSVSSPGAGDPLPRLAFDAPATRTESNRGSMGARWLLSLDARNAVIVFPRYMSNPLFGGRPQYEIVGTSLATVFFLTPIRDDLNPYSLQPFLQRTSMVEWGAGLDETRYQIEGRSPNWRRFVGGFASFGLDIYIRPWLALRYGSSVEYVKRSVTSVPWDPYTIGLLPNQIGIGIRAGDTRIDASYQLTLSTNAVGVGVFDPYGFSLSIRSVLARRVDVVARGDLRSRDLMGTLSIGVSPLRELTLSGALRIGLDRVDHEYHSWRLGGSFAAVWWFLSGIGASVTYAPIWNGMTLGDGTGLVTHAFAFGLFARL